MLRLSCPTLSTRGFLPEIKPLAGLPATSPLNISFNQLIHSLPVLLKEKRLRAEIQKLNFSDTKKLQIENEEERKTAILILTMLAQAYIWEDSEQPAKKIPRILAGNLTEVCKHRFPTLTYADYILQNWRLIHPEKPITLDNIEPLFTFTGTKDEAWFIKIHVAIEAEWGNAIEAAKKLCLLSKKMSLEHATELTQLLQHIAESLTKGNAILRRMKEGCDPNYFFHTLRKYLNGWQEIQFEDESKVHSYAGSSGAQSSVIPALDNALGIKHDMNDMHKMLIMFREYMPSEHQEFIQHVSDHELHQTIHKTQSHALFSAWENAVNAVKLFRELHLGIVEQFIFKPAEKIGIARDNNTGTGGTTSDVYLGIRLQSTKNIIHELKSTKKELTMWTRLTSIFYSEQKPEEAPKISQPVNDATSEIKPVVQQTEQPEQKISHKIPFLNQPFTGSIEQRAFVEEQIQQYNLAYEQLRNVYHSISALTSSSMLFYFWSIIPAGLVFLGYLALGNYTNPTELKERYNIFLEKEKDLLSIYQWITHQGVSATNDTLTLQLLKTIANHIVQTNDLIPTSFCKNAEGINHQFIDVLENTPHRIPSHVTAMIYKKPSAPRETKETPTNTTVSSKIMNYAPSFFRKSACRRIQEGVTQILFGYDSSQEKDSQENYLSYKKMV